MFSIPWRLHLHVITESCKMESSGRVITPTVGLFCALKCVGRHAGTVDQQLLRYFLIEWHNDQVRVKGNGLLLIKWQDSSPFSLVKLTLLQQNNDWTHDGSVAIRCDGAYEYWAEINGSDRIGLCSEQFFLFYLSNIMIF